MLIGSLSLNAQDKAELIQDNAKNQAYELRKAFGLNDTQTKALFTAIYTREKTLNFTDYSAMNKNQQIKFNAQVNDDFKSALSGILTEEQLRKYAEWMKKKKNNSEE